MKGRFKCPDCGGDAIVSCDGYGIVVKCGCGLSGRACGRGRQIKPTRQLLEFVVRRLILDDDNAVVRFDDEGE